SLDVVDGGRTAPQSLLGRERGFEAHDRRYALDGTQQGGLLAADVGTLPLLHAYVAGKLAAEKGAADEAGRPRLLARSLRGGDGRRILEADVHHRFARSGGVRRDENAFELSMRVALEQLLVDVGAGIALVAIDDDELASPWPGRLANRLELDPG